MIRVEALLSARLFLQPQLLEERIFFLSNLSGHISLYAMDYGGSVPEPLLPPHIALQNPHLIEGKSYFVFPKLNQILVMIDKDGDENYQPMTISIDGGFPEPAFNNIFAEYRVHLGPCYPDTNQLFLFAESRKEPIQDTYLGNLKTGELTKVASSEWGALPTSASPDFSKVTLVEGYTAGDSVLYVWSNDSNKRSLIYGTPVEARKEGERVPLTGFGSAQVLEDNQGILAGTTLFEDTGGLGYLDANNPGVITPVKILGAIHTGMGEFEEHIFLTGNRYLLRYNIDGCTWLYEGTYNHETKNFNIHHVICGQGMLSNGVLEAVEYDKSGDRLVLAFSTATSPTQIFTVEGSDRTLVLRHTNERLLGISSDLLSSGVDASFNSFDGTRISARLYLPAKNLGFEGPRPLVYYIHGGPQGQERPDFAWFSMPLIQLLIMNGFAVFVPNVRGSTGYGLNYTKQVDRDWGGQDRLDHVFAMTEVLPKDPRIDVRRAGVVGRSYGGYMTLTLAGRHPELWSAAVDMFGPYDLVTFSERIPETWKPYFKMELGDPQNESDRQFLIERSPSTYINQLACPMLVIQGKNDPRVVERESRDVVENLRAAGKNIDYLMFENEGHDVLKFENRVTCYNAITDYFKKHL
jgi:pimeloyl-ACP methyl ester carboxylesterase